MMGNKTSEPLLISPKEVIRLSREYGTIDTIDIVSQLIKEWRATESRTDTYTQYCMLSAIFEAGRLQGKREERRKRT